MPARTLGSLSCRGYPNLPGDSLGCEGGTNLHPSPARAHKELPSAELCPDTLLRERRRRRESARLSIHTLQPRSSREGPPSREILRGQEREPRTPDFAARFLFTRTSSAARRPQKICIMVQRSVPRTFYTIVERDRLEASRG